MSVTTAPAWFGWAVRQPRRSQFAVSAGARIHYAALNPQDDAKPGLLFLHGFLGHSHWWDFIAPKLRQLPPPEGDVEMLKRIRVPVDYVRAGRSSIVSAERARAIHAAIPSARRLVTLPHAHHHLMLDQPLALVAVLQELLV